MVAGSGAVLDLSEVVYEVYGQETRDKVLRLMTFCHGMSGPPRRDLRLRSVVLQRLEPVPRQRLCELGSQNRSGLLRLRSWSCMDNKIGVHYSGFRSGSQWHQPRQETSARAVVA